MKEEKKIPLKFVDTKEKKFTKKEIEEGTAKAKQKIIEDVFLSDMFMFWCGKADHYYKKSVVLQLATGLLTGLAVLFIVLWRVF